MSSHQSLSTRSNTKVLNALPFTQKLLAKKPLTRILSKSLFAVGLSLATLTGCTDTAEVADTQTTQSDDNTLKETKTIAITQIVEHPSLDEIRRGIIEELADNGYIEGQNLNINFQSAQGNMGTAGQIAKQFAGDMPDTIIPISTPSAQSVVASTTTIPVIYTAISDPVAAKLIDKNNVPIQQNVTGLSSQFPIDPPLDLIQKIVPDAKTIGYVYSPGESNSVAVLKQLQEAAPARGLKILDVAANRSTDVAMATRSLDGRADVIYTSLDNNVISAFESMATAANELDIPIITSDGFSVRRGATAALGVNDYDFGRETGKMVYRVLNGEAPTEIKPAVMNELTLYISPKHATEQGLILDVSSFDNAINVDDKE